MPDIPFASLRALMAIAAAGSVSKAAQTIGLTQSALSHAVANLERRLQVRLLRRGEHPITLTREGRRVVEAAGHIDRQLASMIEDVAALRRRQAGVVRIGSFGSSATARLLPPLIGAFGRAHPGVSLAIAEAPDAETVAALAGHDIDLAIVSLPQPGFETVEIARDQLVAVMAADHALAELPAISATHLGSRPFIMTRGGSQDRVRAWFAAGGVTPTIRHSALQVTSILGLVRAGAGVAIVAELALPDALPGVAVRPLVPRAVRRVGMARHSGTPVSVAADAFWRFVEHRRGDGG